MNAADPLIQAALIGEALDAGPALVFVADEHMRFTAVNEAVCAELGYPREELLGMAVTDVCRYEGAPAEYAEMMQTRRRRGYAVVTRRDGSTFRLCYLAGETRVAGLLSYVSVGCAE